MVKEIIPGKTINFGEKEKKVYKNKILDENEVEEIRDEKLDGAFDLLKENGIITVEGYLCCPGCVNLLEEIDKNNIDKNSVEGYAVYTESELEKYDRKGYIDIVFGSVFSEKSSDTKEVWEKIVSTLKNYTELEKLAWDGKPGSSIRLVF